ncbi:hypothetical protein [Streptomyces sp. NBC_01304]|uniref:hypothetical protein n=1 Tax=Streptomyces sp. NBC_01304 TaxID=2903818 RepID=UPI002E0E490C|nr:hypothetical protein OG430_44720 [Streptomyces sp. NBC_01304]
MPRALGCPDTYTVVLHYRGGPAAGVAAVIADPAVIKWTRTLDDISRCEILLTKPVCGPLRKALDPATVVNPEWAYEITLYRGDEDQPVWCGPLVDYQETRTSLKLTADDMLAWLKVRPVPLDYRYTGASALDATDLAVWLMHEAYALDDPAALAFIKPTPAGIPATRRGQAWCEYAWDGVHSLAQHHIDLTTVARTILIGPEQHSVLGRVLRLTEEDFTGSDSSSGLVLERDGYTAATMYTAKAQGLQGVASAVEDKLPEIPPDDRDFEHEYTYVTPKPDGRTVNASTPANVATVGGTETGWRGLVWQLKSMSGTRLIDEVTLTAQRGLARGRHPHYLRMSGQRLHARSPVAMDELIPGARIALYLDETWIRPALTPLRLTDVVVTFDENGERVEITAEPVSVNVEDPTDETAAADNDAQDEEDQRWHAPNP